MKRNHEVYCGTIAFLLTAVFFVCCLKIPALSGWLSSHGNRNILLYGMVLVLFCLLYLLGMVLATKVVKTESELFDHPSVKFGAIAVLLLGQAIFFAIFTTKETEELGSAAIRYLWHTEPLWFMWLVFCVEAVVFAWLYSRTTFQIGNSDRLLYILYGILTVFVFYAMYTPYMYGRENWGDAFHGHAYFASIYNVYHNVPYDAAVTSVYGHYGLLWKIPMELIHGQYLWFTILLALLGAVTHLCAFLVLHKLVRSRMLRILGALAIAFPILGMRGGYYWQLWPHRMLFAMILLYYAAVVLKRGWYGWKSSLAGYLICLLAMIWNTETGLVLAVAWVGVHVCRVLSDRFSLKRFLLCGIGHGAGAIASFLGAWQAVNFYNRLVGGTSNTLGEFLFPLLSSGYMEDVLQAGAELPLHPSAYMAVLLLFAMGVATGISALWWFRGKKENISWKVYLVFFASVSALGRMVYYMNRPAYHNLDCIHLTAAILLAYFGENGIRLLKKGAFQGGLRQSLLFKQSFGECLRSAVSLVCVGALLAVSTGTVVMCSETSYIKSGFHNVQSLEAYLQPIVENVPKDTPAFGYLMTDIYSALQWDTQIYTMDFSDFLVSDGSCERLEADLQALDAPAVLTSDVSLGIWARYYEQGYQWFMDTYALETEIATNGQVLQYYVKK